MWPQVLVGDCLGIVEMGGGRRFQVGWRDEFWDDLFVYQFIMISGGLTWFNCLTNHSSLGGFIELLVVSHFTYLISWSSWVSNLMTRYSLQGIVNSDMPYQLPQWWHVLIYSYILIHAVFTRIYTYLHVFTPHTGHILFAHVHVIYVVSSHSIWECGVACNSYLHYMTWTHLHIWTHGLWMQLAYVCFTKATMLMRLLVDCLPNWQAAWFRHCVYIFLDLTYSHIM